MKLDPGLRLQNQLRNVFVTKRESHVAMTTALTDSASTQILNSPNRLAI